jgi:hypothetical protein
MIVWGGESNDPPVYGKAFMSIKPQRSINNLTSTEKKLITDQLKKLKNVLTITPEIVDPDYLYLIVKSTIYYDQMLSQYSAEGIRTIAISDIYTYLSSTVNKFNKNLRYSPFLTFIDSIDQSILGNTTSLYMKKILTPNTGNLANYQVKFCNPIKQSTDIDQNLTTSGFTIYGSDSICYLDDLNGVLRLYNMDSGIKKIMNTNVGTIDYSAGTVNVAALMITSADPITITVNPAASDIFSIRNTILVINQEDVSVNVIPESPDVTSHITTLRT